MQSLGTDGETLTLALLQPTLIAVPSLLYPQTVLLHWSRAVGVGRDPPQADRARSRASITTYEGNPNGEI